MRKCCRMRSSGKWDPKGETVEVDLLLFKKLTEANVMKIFASLSINLRIEMNLFPCVHPRTLECFETLLDKKAKASRIFCGTEPPCVVARSVITSHIQILFFQSAPMKKQSAKCISGTLSIDCKAQAQCKH